MNRYATIDIGTNSVLLLVAERDREGRWQAVQERAEITRLGGGVDKTGVLSADGMQATVEVVEKFSADALNLGAQSIAVTATSAVRDARNGDQFRSEVRRRAGLEVETLSGDDEARLAYASARADFGDTHPLVVLDIGGGSTEFIVGKPAGDIAFRKSFDVGAVRLTERHIRSDPPAPAELAQLVEFLRGTFAAVPSTPPNSRLVGLAGTVTTVCAIARKLETYDARVVQGARLTRSEVAAVVTQLAELPLARRRATPGLQPKRADVIIAGAVILQVAMEAVAATEVIVSDRGLRWGLLLDRFGTRSSEHGFETARPSPGT